jgi:DNA-binding MarR family transcriptional regulator
MTTSALAREIRQTRPFSSLREEGLLALFRTTDALRQRVGATIETRGITAQQYNVLRILRGAGEGGLPTLDIADRMIEHAPGITRLLDRLESKGLVSRKRCAKDRRQVLCTLAPGGARLLSRLDLPVSAAVEGALGMLQKPQLLRLIRLLDRIRAGGTGQSGSKRRSRAEAGPRARA